MGHTEQAAHQLATVTAKRNGENEVYNINAISNETINDKRHGTPNTPHN
ncbi:MAG: hypothetical protein Q7J64_01560 [Elusimicrobiota bacterium]|nr:hypothetical protein [Elusimicrobiota bacterium]